MDRLFKYLKNTSVKLTLALFALLLILAVSIDITIHDQGGYMILFSLIYVLLPGLLFVAAVDKDFFNRFRVQAVIIAFFCGVALLIGQYYLLNSLGLLSLIKFTPLAVIILLAILCAKNLKQPKPIFDKTKFLNQALPYLILIVITMVASYVALKSSVPDESTPIHVDYSYHMGNINILTRGGNLEDTRVMGMTFKYHYFMNLYFAIMRLIFPATIWNCVFRYPILLIAPLAGPSVYSLTKANVKKSHISFITSLFILLFPSICPGITRFSIQTITNFNNCGISLPLGISLAQLFIFSTRKESKYSDLVFIFLITLVLSGTKGHFALLLLATMFIFVIYYTIAMRKASRYQVLSFITALIAFAIIWFALLSSSVNNQSIPTNRTGISKYFDYLVILDEKSILLYHDWDPKYALLTIPLSVLESLGGAAIPFFILVPYLIILPFRKKHGEINFATVFQTICVFISVILACLLPLGYNRLYFLMFPTPFIYMSAAWFLVYFENSENKVISIVIKAVKLISICILAVTLYCSLIDPLKIYSTEPLLQGEIDGIAWIRENTDENALLAINDHSPANKQYFYSAFTERRFYLESYVYASNSGKTVKELESQAQINEKLFTGNDSAEIANELGIDYFIYYDTTGGIPEVLEENYRLCYSNDCLRIYSRT